MPEQGPGEGNGRTRGPEGVTPASPARRRPSVDGLSPVPDGSVIVSPSLRSRGPEDGRSLLEEGLPDDEEERDPYRPATLKELRAAKRNGPTSETVKAIRRAARQRRIRRRRIVVSTVLAGLVILAAAVGWYELQAHPGGSGGPAVLLEVQKGETSGAIANDLAQKGVVTSGVAYHFYTFFHTMPTAIPGPYLFHRGMSFGEVNQILGGGPNVTTLHIPAGFALWEVAKQVGQLPGHSAAHFNQVVASGVVHSPWQAAGSTDLEGLVAPGIYPVLPGESDRAILEAMVRRFDAMAASVGATPQAAARLGITPNQLVTVASIVQKEGYIPSNMPKVARTIYNRLAQGMPLQMDSTVLYSEHRDGGLVTQQDEQIQSPYNTYLNTGLPPTPVAAPSPDALSAAAHPPPGNWLYFVVIDAHGDEAFTSSYQQQLQNEQLAQSRNLP